MRDKMNFQVALRGLPIPSDCVDIINEYLFLHRTVFKNKLIHSSILWLMRTSMNEYNYEIYEYYEPHDSNWDILWFRWFSEHTQFQCKFCIQCGNYKQITNGIINQSARCHC
jgi:hypothetical protein